MEPIWRGIEGWPPSDFPLIARRDTAWPTVLRHLGVFQFTEKYAAHADFEELRSIIGILQSNGVEIGLQGVALQATTQCGLGVESFGTVDETARTAARLRQAGAKVAYVTFDEPLYYGHFFKGGRTTKGCLLPVPDIIDQIGQREAVLRHMVPALKIGDVEPFGLGDVAADRWAAAYRAWLDAYRAKNGRDWDFVQADIVWTRPDWRPSFLDAWHTAQSRHIPLGVFYTGSAADRSDVEWARSVASHYEELEGKMGVRPQQAIIASWTDHPRRLFPESDPNTMMGVALGYCNYGRHVSNPR